MAFFVYNKAMAISRNLYIKYILLVLIVASFKVASSQNNTARLVTIIGSQVSFNFNSISKHSSGITKPNYTRFGVELADTVTGGSGITGWKIEANPAAGFASFMTKKPKISDVKSVFAGLRPLAASKNINEPIKEVSRHHKVTVSTSGLISVLGGKWTTYRKIAEDTVNTVQTVGGLSEKKCKTEGIPIFGYDQNTNLQDPLHFYGTEAKKIEKLSKTGNDSLSKKLHITKNQILWALREEMAISLEDILARRTRCLFLDSSETEKIAEEVVMIMADEMKKNNTWINQELKTFKSLVKNYKI